MLVWREDRGTEKEESDRGGGDRKRERRGERKSEMKREGKTERKREEERGREVKSIGL